MTIDRKARERATNAHFMTLLKGAISEAGLTYTQVDAIIDVAEGSTGRWMRNVQIMRAPAFVAICAAVGADPVDLMRRAVTRINRDGLLDDVSRLPRDVEVEQEAQHVARINV